MYRDSFTQEKKLEDENNNTRHTWTDVQCDSSQEVCKTGYAYAIVRIRFQASTLTHAENRDHSVNLCVIVCGDRNGVHKVDRTTRIIVVYIRLNTNEYGLNAYECTISYQPMKNLLTLVRVGH